MRPKGYTLSSVNEVRQICSEYLKKYPEIKDLIFTRGFSNGARAVLTTDGERIEHSYVLRPKTKKYCLTEIPLPEYIVFSHFIDRVSNEFRQTYEAELKLQREKFKLTEELLFVKKGAGYSDHFSITTDLQTDKAMTFFLNHLEELKSFSNYFYWAASSLIKKSVRDPVIGEYQDFERLGSDNLFSLSRQQLRICQLIVEGKSSKEIGKEISLSYRTIEHYLENIKNKLGVKSKSDLIISLLKYGAQDLG